MRCSEPVGQACCLSVFQECGAGPGGHPWDRVLSSLLLVSPRTVQCQHRRAGPSLPQGLAGQLRGTCSRITTGTLRSAHRFPLRDAVGASGLPPVPLAGRPSALLLGIPESLPPCFHPLSVHFPLTQLLRERPTIHAAAPHPSLSQLGSSRLLRSA